MWFSAPSRGAASGAGRLMEYVNGGRALPGMTNPPQNPAVQRELAAYLQSCKVPAVTEPRKLPSVHGSQQISVQSSVMSSASGRQSSRSWGRRSNRSFGEGSAVGGTGKLMENLLRCETAEKSREPSSSSTSRLPSRQMTSESNRQPSRSRGFGQGYSPPQHGDMDERKALKDLTNLPEDAAIRKSRQDLSDKRRLLLAYLNRKDPDEMCQLKFFHNGLARKSTARSRSPEDLLLGAEAADGLKKLSTRIQSSHTRLDQLTKPKERRPSKRPSKTTPQPQTEGGLFSKLEQFVRLGTSASGSTRRTSFSASRNGSLISVGGGRRQSFRRRSSLGCDDFGL